MHTDPYLIDLQPWTKVCVYLFKEIYSSAGNIIITLNYNLHKKNKKRLVFLKKCFSWAFKFKSYP